MPGGMGPVALPYLHHPWRLALVFGAFFVVQVPLVVYALPYAARGDLGIFTAWPTVVFLAVFGLSHFFITFLLYFQGENRRHFTSSPERVGAYLVLPALILFVPAVFFGFGLDARFGALALGAALVMRAMDFYHLNRQSFGVLQLMKGRANAQMPTWVKPVENAYFLSLAVMMLLTFLSPGAAFDGRSIAGIAGLGLVGITLAATVAGYLLALRAGATRREVGLGLAYLALQTAAAAPAIVWTGFYAFTLAVHYVEYHVLMVPRWREVPLDADAPLDQALGWLRARPWLLYGGLVSLGALFFVLRGAASLPEPPVPRPLLHVFDGLFLFHYVLDMFTWKFTDPYYRRTLGPLYAAKPVG